MKITSFAFKISYFPSFRVKIIWAPATLSASPVSALNLCGAETQTGRSWRGAAPLVQVPLVAHQRILVL